VETTNVTSTVVGTGASARVVKTYDVTAIEPITFSFTFKGPPSFGPSDAGKKATLAFSGGGAYANAGQKGLTGLGTEQGSQA
jgi:hypothetical protein